MLRLFYNLFTMTGISMARSERHGFINRRTTIFMGRYTHTKTDRKRQTETDRHTDMYAAFSLDVFMPCGDKALYLKRRDINAELRLSCFHISHGSHRLHLILISDINSLCIM